MSHRSRRPAERRDRHRRRSRVMAARHPEGEQEMAARHPEEEQGTDDPQVLEGAPTSLRESLYGKMADLVGFLLQKYHTRQPTTEEEIVSWVLRSEQLFPSFFKKACECMQLVLGIDVQEVDARSHTYILTTTLGLTYNGLQVPEQGLPKTGLLVIVLGLIAWEGHWASEEAIWNVLNMLGVYAGREHFIYGEPRELLTNEWVQERYLLYRQLPGTSPARFAFLWGPRAYAETTTPQVLERCIKINDRGMKYFSQSAGTGGQREEGH
ncbi:melanoma-associated antigen 8-like [Erinaceus europaeus]|uniref:Melanoma-associated antigen 8-like n=1 Tax=Erinaceus europaeus TaxID=9365 RepID=A0ABM3WS34_ERIEU|nr:melanoma-associated antigen 8-like [Erinaceus europaeus]